MLKIIDFSFKILFKLIYVTWKISFTKFIYVYNVYLKYKLDDLLTEF